MIRTDVQIKGGGYIAEFRSDLGGTCYRLYHEASGAELLRTPETEEALFSEIYLYGNPMLFPCNRIRGGSFAFDGREYRFPVNEPATGCHIHGALYKTPFAVRQKTENSVVFVYRAKAGEYLSFPHGFTVERTYSLSENGLTERVEVANDSDENMPFMLAFHTTLNVPFIRTEKRGNYKLFLPVGREQVRDEKYLPTLEYVGGRAREQALSKGEYEVLTSSASALYESRGAIAKITDEESGFALCYEASEEYEYRMLWRRENADFVVIEPQTCAIDCFHLEKPAKEKGLIVIPPKRSVTLQTRFFMEKTEK